MPTISTQRLVPALMPTNEVKRTGIQITNKNPGPRMSKSLIDIFFAIKTIINTHKENIGNDRKVRQQTSAKLFKLNKLGINTKGLIK